jgi:putative oxidoreductase
MKIITFIGRILFSLMFLTALMSHFDPNMIGYAASQGVPMASVLVPLSGIMAGAGALSIIFGYKTKIGAWLIIIFLLPITFTMHNFWAISDPMASQLHLAMFMKNLSMIGGALILASFGAGPLSLDERLAKRGSASISQTKLAVK